MPKVEPTLNINPTQQNIAQCLQEYGIEDFNFSLTARGVENTTVIVRSEKGNHVLRVYKRDRYTDKQIQHEIDFVQFLYQKGHLVPKLVPNVRKKCLSHTIIDNTKWQHILMTRMQGEHINEYAPDIVAQLGRAMAHLHKHSLSFSTSITGSQITSEPEIITPSEKIEIFPDQVKQAFKRAKDFSINSENLPKAIVHGDITKANTLFLDGKLSAILDFEAIHKGYLIEDIGVTLWGILYNIAFKNADKSLVLAFLESYQHIRTLTNSELEHLPQALLLRTYQLLDTDAVQSESDDESLEEDLKMEIISRKFKTEDYQ